MKKMLPEFGLHTNDEFDVLFLQCLQEFDFKPNPNLFPIVQALVFNEKFRSYSREVISNEAES